MNAVDRSIAEGYPLSLREVLATARAMLPGSKRILLAGAALWLALSIGVTALGTLLGISSTLTSALVVLATAPITAGVVMAGARRARGESLTLQDLRIPPATTAHVTIVLLVNLLVVVGSESLLGPVASLPLLLAYGLFASLAPYLVVDRAMGAGAALRASALLVRHRAGRLLLLQLLLAAMLLLLALPLGIGLIWGIPLALIAQGAVYVRAVGSARTDPT
jgi:hypothetical protein